MSLPDDNTIALCPHCRAPLKPHPYDPSYSKPLLGAPGNDPLNVMGNRDKPPEPIPCVLCGKPKEHSIHRV